MTGNNRLRLAGPGTVLFTAFATTALIVGMIGRRNAVHSDAPLVVYVCRETGAVFLSDTQVVPQIHPETNRATLFPGLYCPHCETWKPAPPMDRLYVKPAVMNCPTCRTARSFEGEIPEDAEHL